MADNVAITAGTGTSIATDDVGGIQFQKVKIDVGSDGVSAPLSSSNPIPVSDAGGSLTVDGTVAISGSVTVASHAVTNAGTFATQVDGAALTSLQLIDDLALAQASSTSGAKGVLAQGAVTTASPSYTNAQTSPLSLDTAGSLRVAIVSGAGSGGTAIADDAAFTVASTSVTPAAGVYKSTRDAVDDGDAGAFAMTPKRAQYISIETPNADSAMDDSLDALKVSIVGDTVGSTVDTEDGTVAAAQSSVALVIDLPYEFDGTNWVRPRGEHTVAHDAADAGNPAKLGAVATASLSGATMVAAADRTNLFAGTDGVLITRPYCNLEDIVTGNASNTDGTSTSCIATSGSGIRTYLTTIILTNMHASTDAYVEIKDGSTVKMTIPIPHASGAVLNLPVPLRGTADTAWSFDPSAAVTTVYCSMIGFKSKV